MSYANYGTPPQPPPEMTLQLSPVPTALFGVASLLPLAGVIGTSAYLVRIMPHGMATAKLDALLVPLLVVFAIAFGQIIFGVLVAILANKRTDLSSTEKAVWSLGCLFVGSMMLPMFWLLVLRRPMVAARPNIPYPR